MPHNTRLLLLTVVKRALKTTTKYLAFNQIPRKQTMSIRFIDHVTQGFC